MDVLKYLNKRSSIVDEEIYKLIPEKINPQVLAEATRHLIKAGGKRLRPVLTLTSCEVVGGKPQDVIEAAAAVELLHTFTLIHDDIMDKDDFRRGVETVHRTWGEPLAIISGDALFAEVFKALVKNAKKAELSANKTIKLFDVVSKASLKICQGQAMDIEFEKRKQVTKKEYLEMVEKKTGALIQTSTEIGGLLGKGSQEEVSRLAKYGRLVGIAFQIQDDILGVVGEEEKAGKPIGSDIKEGKWTFPAVSAYRNANSKEKEILLKALGKKQGEKIEPEKVIRIYRETGAINIAEKKSDELIEKAKAELNIFSETEAKEFLLKLADFSINREF